jgi:hypothetical protein
MHAQLLEWLKDEAHLPEQGSRAWLAIRRTIITASIASDLLGTSLRLFEAAIDRRKSMDQIEIKMSRNYHSRNTMIKRKQTGINTFNKDNRLMLKHGTICEEFIRDFLEREHMQHNALDMYMPLKFRVKNGWIGASPDGCFNMPLRLLEIKTLVYRSLLNGTIPHKYWVQMQVQMYVYGALNCEYCEGRVKFIPTYGEWKYAHGLIRRAVAVRDSAGKIYTCPINQDYDQWHDTVCVPLSFEHSFDILYYHIPELQILQVSYDSEWMEGVGLPELLKAHTEISTAFTQECSSKKIKV